VAGDRMALEILYDDVTARITADHAAEVLPPTVPPEPPAPVPVFQSFGWREPPKQISSSRSVIWVPGDDDTGDLGRMLPPKYPGRNPRPLGNLAELFTVYLSAHDPAAPQNERSQYRATRLLFDEWWRAVYLSAIAHSEISLVKSGWIISKTQHRYGAAIRVVGAIQSMIPDYTLESAPADTKALITVVELGHSDAAFEAPEAP
jgi:hypothetical protein